MDAKNRMLIELGFSDNFINTLNNSSFESNISEIDSAFSCYESISIGGSDFTSLIIERSEEPINMNIVHSENK